MGQSVSREFTLASNQPLSVYSYIHGLHSYTETVNLRDTKPQTETKSNHRTQKFFHLGNLRKPYHSIFSEIMKVNILVQYLFCNFDKLFCRLSMD